MALRIGGVDFNDVRLNWFKFADLKKDPNHLAWKKGFGSLPIIEHGDFSCA